jgi:hypothetical protein
VFVGAGTRRNREDSGKHDALFHLSVDDANSLRKVDKLYALRRNIAYKAQERFEAILKEEGLTQMSV